MSRIYAVGDSVTYSGRPDGRSIRCTVVRVMPVERDARTYRIRADAELFERSVPETTLAPFKRSDAERLFDQ
jgi:hypothetical protein